MSSAASAYDRAQLPRELTPLQTEFNWYIFEGAGRGRDGVRRIAGLISIHRTGPRPQRFELGLQLLTRDDLPSPLRGLVPSWLPIVSPVRVDTDDRPLVMIAIYDLDRRCIVQTETTIEHAELDLATFSVSSATLRTTAATIEARHARFELDLQVRPRKDPVVFGDGSPRLRHGRVETCYVQRPRLDVTGKLCLDGETIEELVGDGAQDRQWLTIAAPNLAWIWPHLRLDDGSELHGYVIRDSVGGEEIGRGGWLVDRAGVVRRLRDFDVRPLRELETARGSVPTRFAVDVRELDLHVVLEHVIPAPFLRMLAFGAALDAGIWEGPAAIVESNRPVRGHCWVEVFDASTARLAADR